MVNVLIELRYDVKWNHFIAYENRKEWWIMNEQQAIGEFGKELVEACKLKPGEVFRTIK